VRVESSSRAPCALLVLVVVKALGYAISLGSGFRGGSVFPAIFLGVGIASIAVIAFDASPTWAVATADRGRHLGCYGATTHAVTIP
jgi:H+/Cl- antiporter ClcA